MLVMLKFIQLNLDCSDCLNYVSPVGLCLKSYLDGGGGGVFVSDLKYLVTG